MYSKQEAAQLRQEFWTAFGQYMSPLLSAEGEKINWVNYKTGEKNIRFRMQADNKMAGIAIELSHKDEGIRQLYYEQFMELKNIFAGTAGDNWQWQPQASDDWGHGVAKIHTELGGVSIFKKEDWPALISFFKQHMIALDEFWSSVKYSFEALR